MNHLAELVHVFQFAKRREDLAREERIRLEEEIAKHIPGPDIGQKTVKVDNNISVTVKRGYNYKTDIDGMREFCPMKRESELPIKEKTEWKLNESQYETIRQSDPNFFQEISKWVEATPKKVAITVKDKNEST